MHHPHPHPPLARARFRVSPALLLVPLLVAAGACGDRDHPELPEGTPVVVISVDTLRSDRLPAYGYDGVETPAIDALRADGVLYRHAYAHSPLTLPSHASLLTGHLPQVHGVRDNMGYTLDAERHDTLAEILREAGYRTGAAVSTAVLRSTTGLDAGFDLYDDRVRSSGGQRSSIAERPGRETLEVAAEWLRGAADEPLLLFFHIYEPHTPYAPPEPFASRYPSAYDGEVAQADRIVGELLDELRELGIYDRALILFLSDHGEGLGDHGFDEHGLVLYREAIQVPLIVKLPEGRRAGDTVDAAAQLVDVVPTVAGLLGLPAPEGLPGRSLFALEGEDAPERGLYAETYYPRIHFGWSHLTSLLRFPHHLIQGPEPELFDLADDPGETEDVLRRNRRLYASLRRELEDLPQGFEQPGEVDPETRRRLAALGYVGSAAGGDREGPLPDPRSKREVMERLRSAYELYRSGDCARAVPAFQAVLQEEPQLLDAWETVGNCLLQRGRPRRALEAFERAFELADGTPAVAFGVARAQLALGRLEEAEELARMALEADPTAYDLLARIALERGDPGRAREMSRRSIEELGLHAEPLLVQAQAAIAEGDFEGALETARRARELAEELAQGEASGRTPRGYHLVRGQALANLGRGEEAARELGREIAAFPDGLAAYTHLALLQALAGNPQETRRALQAMVEANPTPAAYAEAVRTLRVLRDPEAAARLLAFARERWPQNPRLRELTEG